MIPSGFVNPCLLAPQRRYRQELNILTRFCFTLGWVFSIFAGVAAAESGAPSQHLKSVVRFDAHTGKLVRSVVISPRAVAEKKVSSTVVAPRVIEPAAVPRAAAPEAVSTATTLNQTVEEIAAAMPYRLSCSTP